MNWLKLILTVLIFLPCEAQENTLRKIIPDHAKVQFAGTIGFVSAGFGYSNKRGSLEADLHYGYVPKQFGGATLHSLTGKLTGYPLAETKFMGLHVKPLSVGILGSYTFGKQFFLYDPENYPYNYYGFPTALHAGFFIGGSAGTKFHGKPVRGVAVYYELGTTDKELKSYLGNHSIPFRGIFNLGVGIRTNF
jgi:hypothetical protein